MKMSPMFKNFENNVWLNMLNVSALPTNPSYIRFKLHEIFLICIKMLKKAISGYTTNLEIYIFHINCDA